MMSGLTPELRSTSACQRASDLHANIIVYGALDTRSTPAQLSLELCARNPQPQPRQRHHDELQQFDRLGGPLTVNLPLQDVQGSVNAPARVRHSAGGEAGGRAALRAGRRAQPRANLRQALAVFNEALATCRRKMARPAPTMAATWSTTSSGASMLWRRTRHARERAAAELGRPRRFCKRCGAERRFGRAEQAGRRVFPRRPRRARRRAPQATSWPRRSTPTPALAAAIAPGQPCPGRGAYCAGLDRACRPKRLMAQPARPTGAADALSRADRERWSLRTCFQPSKPHSRRCGMARGLVAHQRAQLLGANKGKKRRDPRRVPGAIDAYQQCIGAGLADPGDLFLQRQIVNFTCRPLQETARAALARLPQ